MTISTTASFDPTKHPVQAKFRCLNTTHDIGHNKAHLVAVMAKEYKVVDGGYVEEVTSPENLAFWSATPSGDCDLGFGERTERDWDPQARKHIEVKKTYPGPAVFEQNACYKIEILPPDSVGPDADLWYMADMSINPHGGGFSVTFYRRVGSGKLTMGIENRGAIQHFLSPVMAQFIPFLRESPEDTKVSKLDADWAFVFTKVE